MLPRLLASLPAAVVTVGVAMGLGVVTGLAGRVVALVGLYEVLAALVLSIVAVAACHLFRHRPGKLAPLLAILAALAWMAAHRVTDAWAFRSEQAQAVQQEAAHLVDQFVAAGADTPLQLVDAGLQAETGHGGLRGALMVLLKGGVVATRALGQARVLPASLAVHVAVLGLLAGLVAVVIHRALVHLAGEPICATCQRYLRRRQLGHVDADEAARLAEAWSQGQREEPHRLSSAGIALAYEDTCPAGHTQRPGYALVRARRRGLARTAPGPLAALPPMVDPQVQSPT